MFKEIYKNANDKIASDDACARFIAEIDGRKKKNIKPAVMRAAALAACFTFAFCGVKLYDLRPGTDIEVPVTPMTAVSPTPEAYGTNDEIVTEEQIQSVPKTEKNHVEKPKKTAEKPKKTAEPTQEIAQNSMPTAQDVSADAVSAEQTEPIQIEEEHLPAVTSLSAEEGGMRAAGAVMRNLDDYIEFIGTDIRENICVPDGMTDKTAETDSAGDGWRFVYEGEGKRVEVQTYPAETDACTADVSIDDGNAEFTANGINFVVKTEGLTMEELDILVKSLQ